jgi:hypothetical protein
MNALSQIAAHLEIEASQIIKCEEWATVWFVVTQNKGGRFVSKKVVKRMSAVNQHILAKEGNDHQCLRFLVVESVRRFNNTGNRSLTLDLARSSFSKTSTEDSESLTKVAKSCDVLIEANVCTFKEGKYLLTDAGIRYGNHLIS